MRSLLVALAVTLTLAASACAPDPPQRAADPAVGSSTGGPARPDGTPSPASSHAPSPGAAAPAQGARGTTPGPAPRPTGPILGAWVHLFDDTLKTRASIAAVVDELAAAGATAVFAQVARRHDAYYASAVLPRTADPALEPGLDVLDELLARARPAGLQVHAWVAVAPTWHDVYDDLPRPAGWLPALHGRQAPEGDRWVTRGADGRWSDYLDPALPQVREHVRAVVAELVGRYPVDGVHLDYVRYGSNSDGYHPAALARYAAETGAAGRPAPDDPAWSAWRRAQTRALVDAAAAATDAADRDVMLSAAVITWQHGPTASRPFEATRAYTDALQDWAGWVRDGVLDAVMPMNYFRAHDAEQAGWFNDWVAFEAELAAAADTLVVPGVAGYLNRPAATVAQVRAATAATGGALVYSYQQPTEDASRDVWARLAAENWGLPAR